MRHFEIALHFLMVCGAVYTPWSIRKPREIFWYFPNLVASAYFVAISIEAAAKYNDYFIAFGASVYTFAVCVQIAGAWAKVRPCA